MFTWPLLVLEKIAQDLHTNMRLTVRQLQTRRRVDRLPFLNLLTPGMYHPPTDIDPAMSFWAWKTTVPYKWLILRIFVWGMVLLIYLLIYLYIDISIYWYIYIDISTLIYLWIIIHLFIYWYHPVFIHPTTTQLGEPHPLPGWQQSLLVPAVRPGTTRRMQIYGKTSVGRPLDSSMAQKPPWIVGGFPSSPSLIPGGYMEELSEFM